MPTSEDERIAALKAQYRFDDWQEANNLDEDLFVWNFNFAGNEFPGLALQQLQTIPPSVVPARSVPAPITAMALPSATVAGSPPMRAVTITHSIWKPSEERPETLINIEAFECSSREAAHEFLVRMMGEFELPRIARADHLAIGDVTFATPKETTILFARANILYLVRNAGRDKIPVTDIARQLDVTLVAKPTPPATTAGRRSLASATETAAAEEPTKPQTLAVRVGQAVPLEPTIGVVPIRASVLSPPSRSPVWYKIFSPRGSHVFQEGERLVCKPEKRGTQEVTILAVQPDRRLIQRRLRFKVQ